MGVNLDRASLFELKERCKEVTIDIVKITDDNYRKLREGDRILFEGEYGKIEIRPIWASEIEQKEIYIGQGAPRTSLIAGGIFRVDPFEI